MTSEVLQKWANKSLPRGEHPVRKIVFTIRSKDQGWGGRTEDANTYQGSFTWFDVGKERFEAIDTNERPALPVPPIILRQSELGIGGRRGSFPICCILRLVNPQVLSNTTGTSTGMISHALLPSETKLQSNITASSITKEHIITWAYNDNIVPESAEGDELEKQGRGRSSGNGEYVRNLKLGDVITVWGKARFPGWSNNIEEVKVDVYFAV
jgi:hypothetical protein